MPKQTPGRDTQTEDVIADRIREERKARGWSYDVLSQKMAEKGCPIQPTALHRIEQGTPRRRIVVNELVAFVSVFEGQLTDWVLSPSEAAVQTGLRVFIDAVIARRAAAESIAEYVALVNELRPLIAQYPELAQELSDYRAFRSNPAKDQAARDVFGSHSIAVPAEWQSSTSEEKS